ncbi:MAG: DUF3857 domain-containing protein [Chitinophagaceae bacterium]|nr:DUF3857 domain-containing protein [Chitinophagaceae bacterium]
MKKMTLRLSVCLLLFASAILTVSAQSKSEEKYRKESEKIRNEVWAWDRPEFKSTAVPDKYNNTSQVIIAHHTELVADSRSKLIFYGLGFNSEKAQTLTEIVREMVKVNDKSAVEEFSELSFTRFEVKSGFLRNNRSTTFVGVRIIKPDQSVKEVNADDMVLTLDGDKEKKAKLAIPDLQPGDVIDYFIATEQKMSDDYAPKQYNILLFDDAPVLHYSFHGQLGKKYAIDYRSYNGAPDLTVTKNRDKEVIIDVEKKDMPAYESSLWISAQRQLPLIRMNISLGYRGIIADRYLGAAKPGEVNKDIDTDEIVKDLAKIYSQQFYFNYSSAISRKEYDEIVGDAQKKGKSIGLDIKAMPDDEKAAYLYYYTRFSKLLSLKLDNVQRSINAGNYTYNGLAVLLNCIMKSGDIDAGILVASPRTGFRMSEVLDADDLVSTAYLEGSKKIIHVESIYDHPFTIPQSMDGEKDTRTIELKKKGLVMSPSGTTKLASAGPGFALPLAKAPQNIHLEELKITLNPGETKLAVQRTATLTGYYKSSWQRKLILYEDYYEYERKLVGEKETMLEALAGSRKTSSMVEDVKSALADARKKHKDECIDEAKSWFEQEVTDLKDFKIEKMGVRHTDPDFVFSETFALDGLVKKAGNNIIFEIGKIQGQPLAIKDNQRKRAQDVYMPYARSIGYDLRIQIPEGYSVEGLDALKKSVENETGYFKTEARVDGQVITVTVKKGYFHNFEPASNWDKMLAFMDASNEWESAKLLFKKN